MRSWSLFFKEGQERIAHGLSLKKRIGPLDQKTLDQNILKQQIMHWLNKKQAIRSKNERFAQKIGIFSCFFWV